MEDDFQKSTKEQRIVICSTALNGNGHKDHTYHMPMTTVGEQKVSLGKDYETSTSTAVAFCSRYDLEENEIHTSANCSPFVTLTSNSETGNTTNVECLMDIGLPDDVSSSIIKIEMENDKIVNTHIISEANSMQEYYNIENDLEYAEVDGVESVWEKGIKDDVQKKDSFEVVQRKSVMEIAQREDVVGVQKNDNKKDHKTEDTPRNDDHETGMSRHVLGRNTEPIDKTNLQYDGQVCVTDVEEKCKSEENECPLGNDLEPSVIIAMQQIIKKVIHDLDENGGEDAKNKRIVKTAGCSQTETVSQHFKEKMLEIDPSGAYLGPQTKNGKPGVVKSLQSQSLGSVLKEKGFGKTNFPGVVATAHVQEMDKASFVDDEKLSGSSTVKPNIGQWKNMGKESEVSTERIYTEESPKCSSSCLQTQSMIGRSEEEGINKIALPGGMAAAGFQEKDKESFLSEENLSDRNWKSDVINKDENTETEIVQGESYPESFHEVDTSSIAFGVLRKSLKEVEARCRADTSEFFLPPEILYYMKRQVGRPKKTAAKHEESIMERRNAKDSLGCLSSSQQKLKQKIDQRGVISQQLSSKHIKRERKPKVVSSNQKVIFTRSARKSGEGAFKGLDLWLSPYPGKAPGGRALRRQTVERTRAKNHTVRPRNRSCKGPQSLTSEKQEGDKYRHLSASHLKKLKKMWRQNQGPRKKKKLRRRNSNLSYAAMSKSKEAATISPKKKRKLDPTSHDNLSCHRKPKEMAYARGVRVRDTAQCYYTLEGEGSSIKKEIRRHESKSVENNYLNKRSKPQTDLLENRFGAPVNKCVKEAVKSKRKQAFRSHSPERRTNSLDRFGYHHTEGINERGHCVEGIKGRDNFSCGGFGWDRVEEIKRRGNYSCDRFIQDHAGGINEIRSLPSDSFGRFAKGNSFPSSDPNIEWEPEGPSSSDFASSDDSSVGSPEIEIDVDLYSDDDEEVNWRQTLVPVKDPGSSELGKIQPRKLPLFHQKLPNPSSEPIATFYYNAEARRMWGGCSEHHPCCQQYAASKVDKCTQWEDPQVTELTLDEIHRLKYTLSQRHSPLISNSNSPAIVCSSEEKGSKSKDRSDSGVQKMNGELQTTKRTSTIKNGKESAIIVIDQGTAHQTNCNQVSNGLYATPFSHCVLPLTLRHINLKGSDYLPNNTKETNITTARPISSASTLKDNRSARKKVLKNNQGTSAQPMSIVKIVTQLLTHTENNIDVYKMAQKDISDAQTKRLLSTDVIQEQNDKPVSDNDKPESTSPMTVNTVNGDPQSSQTSNKLNVKSMLAQKINSSSKSNQVAKITSTAVPIGQSGQTDSHSNKLTQRCTLSETETSTKPVRFLSTAVTHEQTDLALNRAPASTLISSITSMSTNSGKTLSTTPRHEQGDPAMKMLPQKVISSSSKSKGKRLVSMLSSTVADKVVKNTQCTENSNVLVIPFRKFEENTLTQKRTVHNLSRSPVPILPKTSTHEQTDFAVNSLSQKIVSEKSGKTVSILPSTITQGQENIAVNTLAQKSIPDTSKKRVSILPSTAICEQIDSAVKNSLSQKVILNTSIDHASIPTVVVIPEQENFTMNTATHNNISSLPVHPVSNNSPVETHTKEDFAVNSLVPKPVPATSAYPVLIVSSVEACKQKDLAAQSLAQKTISATTANPVSIISTIEMHDQEESAENALPQKHVFDTSSSRKLKSILNTCNNVTHTHHDLTVNPLTQKTISDTSADDVPILSMAITCTQGKGSLAVNSSALANPSAIHSTAVTRGCKDNIVALDLTALKSFSDTSLNLSFPPAVTHEQKDSSVNPLAQKTVFKSLTNPMTAASTTVTQSREDVAVNATGSTSNSQTFTSTTPYKHKTPSLSVSSKEPFTFMSNNQEITKQYLIRNGQLYQKTFENNCLSWNKVNEDQYSIVVGPSQSLQDKLTLRIKEQYLKTNMMIYNELPVTIEKLASSHYRFCSVQSNSNVSESCVDELEKEDGKERKSQTVIKETP